MRSDKVILESIDRSDLLWAQNHSFRHLDRTYQIQLLISLLLKSLFLCLDGLFLIMLVISVVSLLSLDATSIIARDSLNVHSQCDFIDLRQEFCTFGIITLEINQLALTIHVQILLSILGAIGVWEFEGFLRAIMRLSVDTDPSILVLPKIDTLRKGRLLVVVMLLDNRF